MLSATSNGTSFHWNLGDVPTWVAVLMAGAAAIVALYALLAQKNEISRQVGALDRQMIEDVEFFMLEGESVEYVGPEAKFRSSPAKYQLVLVVHNQTRRPMRRVWCGASDSVGKRHLQATAGTCYTWEDTGKTRYGVYSLRAVSDEKPVPVVKAHQMYAFVFDIRVMDVRQHEAEFINDAGNAWRIDQDLHLSPVKRVKRGRWTGLLGRPDPGDSEEPRAEPAREPVLEQASETGSA